jgi:hypothetical protein
LNPITKPRPQFSASRVAVNLIEETLMLGQTKTALINLYESCLKRMIRELPVGGRASRWAVGALNAGVHIKKKDPENAQQENSNQEEISNPRPQGEGGNGDQG